ncbi:MAG: chorismate mutase [Henriciella sp.]|uniref:chorismate mutase n=1 Tax=Henriciella sp. TaxID=1968823 RepID=UPI0032EC5B84
MTEAEAIDHLEALRARLDQIDSDLIELLGLRFQTIRDVAAHKHATGIAVMQPSRIGNVFETRMERAREAGLDPKLIERLWTTIITHACQIENEVGQIEGGDLLFQGVSLDHALIEVDNLKAACEMICTRLSFDLISQSGSDTPGERVAVLMGGDVSLIVRERALPAGKNCDPATVAIQVHRLAPTVSELRQRGNTVDLTPGSMSGATMAIVHLPAPANLTVRYVERSLRAGLSPADFETGMTLASEESCGAT